MSDYLEKVVKAGFGFDPTISAHHFLVDIKPGTIDPVYISEHISWDQEVGSCSTTLDNRLDGQLRVLLPRNKWDAIADDVRAVFNQRLRKQGFQSGQWRLGPNLIRRDLGKELLLLAWALEDADPNLIQDALANWKGLAPEERWWMYTQTAAASGHATQGRNIGWRKAVRYAITENPIRANDNKPRDFFLRALNPGPMPELDDTTATQSGLFGSAVPIEPVEAKSKKAAKTNTKKPEG